MLMCALKDCTQEAITVINGQALCSNHFKEFMLMVDQQKKRQELYQKTLAEIDANLKNQK